MRRTKDSFITQDRNEQIMGVKVEATFYFQKVITGVPAPRLKTGYQMKDMDIVFPGVCQNIL